MRKNGVASCEAMDASAECRIPNDIEQKDMPLKRLNMLALGVLMSLPGLTAVADTASQPVAVTPSFTLTIIKAGAGDGSTAPASSPAPGTAYTIASGVLLGLTAVPAADAVFTGWSGDLASGGTTQESTVLVVMDRDRTLTATFLPAQCTLTVQVGGTSNPVNVTPAPGPHGCLSGQQVYISALPADASPASFTAWKGAVDSDSFFAKVVMDGNKTVTANFTDNPDASRKLVVNPPQGPGNCFPLGPGSYRVAVNSTMKFGANPHPGRYFGGWLADYAGIGTPQELAVVMDRDRTIGASFTDTGSTVTVILEGRGDIFPRPGSYALADGLRVPFTAQQTDHEWLFDSWRDTDDKVLSQDSSYLLTVNNTAPATVKGVFKKGKKASEIIARAYTAAPLLPS